MMAHLSNLSRSLCKVFLPLTESTALPNSVTLSHLISFEFSPHYFCTHQSSCSTASVWSVFQGKLLFAFSGNFFPSNSGYALHGGYYYLSTNIQERYWQQGHLSCVPVSREAVADLLKGHRVFQDKATSRFMPCKNSLSGSKRNYFWVFSHAFLTPESVFFPWLCVLGNSQRFGIPYLFETKIVTVSLRPHGTARNRTRGYPSFSSCGFSRLLLFSRLFLQGKVAEAAQVEAVLWFGFVSLWP